MLNISSLPWEQLDNDWEEIDTIFSQGEIYLVITVTEAISRDRKTFPVSNIRQLIPTSVDEQKNNNGALSILYVNADSNTNITSMYIMESVDFIIQIANP